MVPMYESGENYLETILMIEKESKIVRAIDIARKLSVSKPSVSRAMGILRDAGFIDMAENGHGPILLTEKGREKASSIYRRHQVLTDFLQIVTGVDAVKAEAADKYSQLNAQYEALKAEVESLREFKLAVDNQKKDELINSFYMLSDEDKADVIANKTQYTYDEIESKLAVICVRNKVNFTEEKQEETKPVATFTCEEVDTTPAWLKAVQRTQAKNR